MENKNRNVWIIVGIVAILLCLCAAAAAIIVALGAGFFAALPVAQEGGLGRVTERTEQVYTVGQSPLLEVDSFAGNVTVRTGESGRIRAVVTKNARSSDGLQRIRVEVEQRDNGLRIRASRLTGWYGNESVNLVVYVPTDARLELDTGAGNIEVDSVQGEIAAHTGAGNVHVWGAAARVDLDTGAGNIDYEGEPWGEGKFETGAGNISLNLPADANVEIELHTGIGNISLGGFPVEGDTSGTDIQGTIGTGEQATISAETGVGNISLSQR